MEKSRFQVAKLVQCRQIRKSAGIIDSLDLYDIFIISASSRHCKKISKLIFFNTLDLHYICIMDELYYDALDLLKKMVSIPSFSRQENEVADLIENEITKYGFKACRHGNNVWSIAPYFDESMPTLLFNSHIDTVKPADGWDTNPFVPFETEDERIYGLGTNDAGASVVSLLAAFRYLTDCDRDYNLVFLASCEEEVSGRNGIESVLPLLPKADVAIVGEPTCMEPAVAEKGLMVLDGIVTGIAGHAARNEGENAIYNAMDVITALRELTFERESEMLGPVKISVTQIEAGKQHNVIPDRCKIVVDVRTTDAYSNIETLELINKCVGEKCTLVPRSTRLEPSGIEESHPLVKRLKILGKKPFGSPTLSDQALMPFPSVKIGPGDSARSHTANEYICLHEVREAIQTYVTLLDGCHIPKNE